MIRTIYLLLAVLTSQSSYLFAKEEAEPTASFKYQSVQYFRPPTQAQYPDSSLFHDINNEAFAVPTLEEAQNYCQQQGAELITADQFAALAATTAEDSEPIQHDWPTSIMVTYLTSTLTTKGTQVKHYFLHDDGTLLSENHAVGDRGLVVCTKAFAKHIAKRPCAEGVVCCENENSKFGEAYGYQAGDTFTYDDRSYLVVEDGAAANKGIQNQALLSQLANGDIHFCTSRVHNMQGIFAGSHLHPNLFNQDISDWDTSHVTDMSSLFEHAVNFNQDISHWQTGQVRTMKRMFYHATRFNQDITAWQTQQVKDMSFLFGYATQFDQAIKGWDTSHVTDMSYMFYGASKFNQYLNDWDTKQVKAMRRVFYKATSFKGTIKDWDTSQVVDMSGMFRGAVQFNINLNAWDTSQVVDMSEMFEQATNYNQPMDQWNISQATNLALMFEGATSFDQDISSWKPTVVKSMSYMFRGATSFNQDISRWKTASVTDMSHMFESATSFNQPIQDWQVSQVEHHEDFASQSGLTAEHNPFNQTMTPQIFFF